MRTRRENCLLSPESPSFRAAEQIIRRLKSGRRERNFWMQRREAKNRPKRPLVPAETERPERYQRISPQKRPIWSLPGSPWFGRTGWWCAQSDTNPSPCYLANIRVIFENNSEPAVASVKNACSTGISRILLQFDIREEQGAPNYRN